MRLYEINDKGELIQINNLKFAKEDVYIVDDDKTIYIWFGLKISQKKRDSAIYHARNLNKMRFDAAKLLLMTQHAEYGAFYAMMDDLKKGVEEDRPRRVELDL
ncbi:MAG: hypothetical protein ACTSQS_18665, partial [Promethearchaeota archaeon]